MTVNNLIEKLNSEYSKELIVAIEVIQIVDDVPVPVHVYVEDIKFSVQKFKDESSEKPYYKLIITPDYGLLKGNVSFIK